MKKYDSILKRVEQVEYKLGISYAKTNGKLYKTAWVFALLGVIYLSLINMLVIISTVMNGTVGNEVKFSNQTLVFLALSVVFEISAIIFAKKSPKILGGILGIVPVPYLCFVFIKSCYSYGVGLFNIQTIFYTRHLPSILIIAVSFLILLFVSLREHIKTNRSYKRIITNIYNNYMNEHKSDTLDVSDEEWEDFIKNYSPRNKIKE